MTYVEFRAAFIEFVDEPDSSIARAMVKAAPYFNVARWGGFYAEGFANCTAHFVALEKTGQKMGTAGMGKAGDVTSASAENTSGRASKSRGNDAVMAQMTKPFMRTQYGQRYLDLRKMVGMGPVVA